MPLQSRFCLHDHSVANTTFSRINIVTFFVDKLKRHTGTLIINGMIPEMKGFTSLQKLIEEMLRALSWRLV